MSTTLKQTFTEFEEKKHSIRMNAKEGDSSAFFSNAYVLKKPLEKAKVKTSKIKSIEVQITIHEK